MTFLRSHISIFILLLFILCSNYIFGQDLKGNNVILPATNSTVGSIKIGSWNALNMYGVKNIYVGNSGNFNSPASDSNAAFGYGALRLINNASRNVAIGPYAGGRIVNADGNIWIGNEAGNDSTFKNIDNIGGIDNSDTICPLIYFDFENNQVRICGTLDVNNGITGIDSVLWYLNGDTIRNKSRHLVTIDSGLFLTNPQSNTRLGYVLAWEHTNGRVFPVEISQLSDTVTQVGVGYWELINGHLEPIDDIDTAASSVYKADHIQSFTDNYSMQDTLKYDFYIWGNLYDTVAKTFPGNPLYVILDGDFTWTELDTGWSVQAYGYCYDDGGYDYWRDEGTVTSITYDEVILKTIVLFNSDLIHLCVDQSGVPGDAYKKYDTVYFISPSVEIETPVRIIDSLYVEGNTKFNDSVYLERDAIPFLEPGDPLAGVLTLRKLNTGTERQLAMTSISNLIDTLYVNGLDSNYWHYGETEDTIKTDHHVVLDSSFLMKYSNYKFGFNKLSTTMFFVGNQFINDSQHLFNGIIEGVPIPGLGTNPYLALIADDIRDGYGGSAIFIGNTSNFPYYVHELDGIDHTTGIGINDNSYEIFIGDNNEGQAAIFRIDTTSALFKTNFINNVGGFEIHHDTTIFDGIIKTNILPELSSDYLVGWNSLTKQLVATDSSGVVFHSEIGFYQEELSTTKTIFNLGFTITSSALVSLNGVIINPSQWTGVGTSTLTLLLDTGQYDLFTIKQ